ncbi:serine hydrolase [Sphingobacterium sp. JB170]|uniref:serine hydrolase domain-containing protein n=1 Tax=Sphingobacterium sp. JB170 TaxID=1434842 RepID=UPI000B357D3C|nr:serine hydrolase [Sphingobacterium sp. JB170]
MNKRLTSVYFLMVILTLQSCKLGRFVYYNYANITDYKIFPSRTLKAPEEPFLFPYAATPKFPQSTRYNNQNIAFEEFIEQKHSVAFLVIQNDTIQYEKYFQGYDEESTVASFSMAKSFTSMLIGIAIDEGLIKSVNEPVTNYIPELRANGFEAVTIKHLLQMTSGLDFNEAYKNPFGHVATFYYGTNLRKAISKLKLARSPGEKFEYTSGQSQLLGLIVERAIGDRSITDYFHEKIWKSIGMEYDASWSIDRKKDGLEKTFCCVNAKARDFAKLGRLYLHKGNWEGKQIISQKWVEESTKIDTADGSAWNYQYQWWLPSRDGDFTADGLLGQYIYVNPKRNLIIVRLGTKTDDVNWKEFIPEFAKHY